MICQFLVKRRRAAKLKKGKDLESNRIPIISAEKAKLIDSSVNSFADCIEHPPKAANYQPKVQRPDFVGSWVCEITEGDWNTFAMANGQLTSPQRASPGVGNYILNIAQYTVGAGDVLEVEEGDPKTFKTQYSLVVNGSEQPLTGSCGTQMKAQARWEGDVLQVDLSPLTDGHPAPRQMCFYFEDQQLVCELTAATGSAVVRRIFKRAAPGLRRGSSFSPAEPEKTPRLRRSATLTPAGTTSATKPPRLERGMTAPPVVTSEKVRQLSSVDSQFLFKLAGETAKSLSPQPSRQDLLKLYAHFKQGSVGPVAGSRPGMMDPKGQMKWDAWAELKLMDKITAQTNYCTLLDKLAPGWRPAVDTVSPAVSIEEVPPKLTLHKSYGETLTIDGEFTAAQAAATTSKPSSVEMLQLYSMYKQATVGPATGKRPAMTDVKGRMKWDAWAALNTMDTHTAKQRYCTLVDNLVPGWRPHVVPNSIAHAVQPQILHLKATEQSKKPDFSGEWMCNRVEGDWERFRADSSSWVQSFSTGILQNPTAALGVGNHVQHIAQYRVSSGEVIEIEDCHSNGKKKNSMRIDGTDQDYVVASGAEMNVTPSWDGSALVMAHQSFVPGRSAPPNSRRSMQGDEMCLELISDDGFTYQKIFHRVQ